MKISHVKRPVIGLLLAVSAVCLPGCIDQPGETPVSGAVISRAANLQIESASLPACDPNSPETLFINNAADWVYINDPAYRIFCVAPGNYSSLGTIHLTAWGTDTQPRVLRMQEPANGGIETHPAITPESGRAILAQLVLAGAHHWIIDGITVRGNSSTPGELVTIYMQASNNILNHMLIENGSTNLVMVSGQGTNHNTIQNSVIRKSQPQPGMDHHCIAIASTASNEQIIGTRILNNEIYNCTDGIQLTVISENQGSHFPDTLISNNDIYLTSAIYTDCHGTLDPGGNCAGAENGIDIKSGATSPTNAVIITNNRLWGFRETDSLVGGSGSAGPALETCCFNPAYVLISNNIITNSPNGIRLYSGNHISTIDNLVSNIHDLTSDHQGWALAFEGSNQEVYRNTVVNSDHWGGILADNSDYRCNTIINGGDYYSSAYTGVTADYNAYYNSVQFDFPGSNDTVLSDATQSLQTDRCFWRKQWTGPEQVCIPYGSRPASSPSISSCDPQLGIRKNIGVDDSLY
jgi:hypothetical protein